MSLQPQRYHPTHRAFEKDPWNFPFDAPALLEKYRQERDRRIRSDNIQQYVDLKAKGDRYSDWLKDPWVAVKERPALDIETTVLIVGGGFSGIQLAGNLRKSGITDFKIMDRGGDFGGTWYWNRYPGAACDSEAYGYLPLLEEMQYMPTAKYVSGTEILQHCWRMAQTFGIYENALFHTGSDEFVWDENAKLWRCKTDRGDKIACRFLITAGGPLAHPHLPDLPGIDSFKGLEFHTSRWNYAKSGGDPLKLDFNMTNLKDKRVGIIGTGATAIQCVPYLGQSSGKLYVFQRTPSAVDKRDNKPTDEKWWKTLEPGWQAKRDRAFHVNAAGGDPEVDIDDGFSKSLSGLGELVRRQTMFGEHKELGMAELRQLADLKLMESIRQHVDDVVKDKKKAELLKPWYNLFCKRPCYSDMYLQTFNLQNVEIIDCSVTKGVERVTPNGVVVGGKEYELDVIIWSTGFSLPLADHVDYRVLGRGGKTKQEIWKENDGMATLYGIASNGTPNYFNFGSFQAGGSVNFPSVLNAIGIWIAYVVGEAIKRGIQVVEVTREAEENWVKEVLKQNRRDVGYFENCTWREGYVTRATTPQVNREVPYGGSPLRYRRELTAHMEKNDLAGFHLTYLPGREKL